MDQAWRAGTHAAICSGVTSYVGDPVEVVGDVVGDVVGEVVGDVVGEVVGDVVGESVGVELLVVVGEEVAAGPAALVNGVAARTGA